MTGEHKEKRDVSEENTSRVFVRNGIARFKDRLREAMGTESGNSLAKRCGMSEAVIRAYLSGKTYPSLDRLAILAEKCEVSIEWLANGGDTNSNGIPSPLNEYPQDKSQAVTEAQQQAWLEFLSRMTPNEREAIIDKVYRQGIGVLLASIQSASQPVPSQLPLPDDLPERLGISHDAMAMGILYDSLPNKDRQKILADIGIQRLLVSGHEPSDKQAG
ncbi:helix-turn-helix domain-containing protein [Yersinia intermedia]|uniref:helix-turn-helix domain-containing protein n=1 Tax=Yersinia intermedia TaxID=631 RepID=UPI0022FE99AB|nr:helix-turn-helix transcriptional regulator [Yersinia intermedia]MDA5513538.1 helix-turn-helix transcriptional regulator [Yersinia intermedia]